MDHLIQTRPSKNNLPIQTRRPDLVLINKKKKTCHLMEVDFERKERQKTC